MPYVTGGPFNFMKQRNREARLARRREAYDKMGPKKHQQHRPGSLKK